MVDVRMKGFQQRASLAAARQWLDAQLLALDEELISLSQAAGRVLARDVTSRVDVPGFARAMMDGFAVRSTDLEAAEPTQPVRLQIRGDVLPGVEFSGYVAPGDAVRIMTGAPLPRGADAVVPVERTVVSGDVVELSAPTPAGKHVGTVGEDVRASETVLEAGRLLRPQDVGVLSSIGAAELYVVRRPRVRIVVTGDELLPAGSTPRGVRVVDSNGPMLAALIARDGGLAINPGLVTDRPEAIAEAMRDDADVIVVSGGTSVGKEDHAPLLLARDGELAIHGVSLKPASPTGMGTLDGRLVFLLPGNPVSCLCAYDFFAGRAIRALGGLSSMSQDWPYRSQRMTLARPIASVVGRTDYVRVRRSEGGVEPLALGGAALLSSTTRADGFVVVPDECEGYEAGGVVEVFWY